ncbi:MAG: ATP-binding protein [Candidatus Omnitrophota bacterium]
MKKKRILIVDDSGLMREMYKSQLKEAGYEVLTATDGIEAINTAFTGSPDLILLDVHMPKINGYQVCRLLKDRSETKDIPIVIMTALEAGGVIQDPKTWSFQTGADGFYGKGEGCSLIPVVDMYLEKASASEGAPSCGSAPAMSENEIMLALSALLDRQLYLDITRLKALDEMKNVFVSNVAHEFRTPIAIMRGHLENIREGAYGPVTPQQAETVDVMLRTIQRVARLTRDMLDISKIEAGKLELDRQDVDLAKVVKEVAKTFEVEASRKKIKLAFQIPEKAVHFFGDADRLPQVFVNLVSNAIKYTPEGQTVTVRVFEEPQKGFIRAEVEDTGKGIPEDQREKIFDKFTRIGTEQQEGTGLGLPIAQDLVVLHGGKIWVEAVSPSGSRFVVLLPQGNK